MRYADCSLPTGRTGADWVFSGFSGLSCSAYDVRGTTADRQAWLCRYAGPNRGTNYITFARWTTLSAARAHYDGGGSGWTCAGGFSCGWRTIWSPGDRFHRAVVYQDGNNWSASINAATSNNRARGADLIGAFRAPNRLRGVPL